MKKSDDKNKESSKVAPEEEEDEDPNDYSKKKEEDMIKFSKFFTYMTGKEKALAILGTMGALIAGFLLPCMSIAIGALTDTYDPRNGKDKILDNMKKICLYICIVGIVSWIFGYVYYAFW